MLKITLMLLVGAFLFQTPLAVADDAKRSYLAKVLKLHVQKQLAKKFDRYEGYCDVMLGFTHDNGVATLKSVKGTGDSKVCRVAKKSLKKGLKIRTKEAHNLLVIHVTTNPNAL